MYDCFKAKILCDSLNPYNDIRLTTFEITYPRIVHCFHPKTEFLSQINNEFPRWRSFDAINALQAKIAQFTLDGQIEFVSPISATSEFSPELVWHERKTFKLAVTPQHRMFSMRRTTGNTWETHVDTAIDWVDQYTAHRRIPQAGMLSQKERKTINPFEAELIAYYVADGHRPAVGDRCNFHFRKQRKIEAVICLLENLGIDYKVKTYGIDTVITFDQLAWIDDCYTENGEKKYPEFIWQMDHEAYSAFRKGVLLSDGNEAREVMNSTSKEVAEQTQIIAGLNGEAMNLRQYKAGLYKQTFQDSNYVSFRADKDVFELRRHDDRVVCFTVPSSFLYVRFCGFAYISGNSELLTHRALSRNSASSRAIPNKTLRQIISKNGAYPVWWGKNQSGMSANDELTGWRLKLVQVGWELLKQINLFGTWTLAKIGLHKQLANRPIEPWMPITVLVSATDYQNFFHLRCSPFAQPEIKRIAEMMRELYHDLKPTVLNATDYHLPFIYFSDREEVNKLVFSNKELGTLEHFYDHLKKISAGRCARVSYLTHDGMRDVKKDIELCNKLVRDGHWSPLEHIAAPMKDATYYGNFRGWRQFRKEFVNENMKG